MDKTTTKQEIPQQFIDNNLANLPADKRSKIASMGGKAKGKKMREERQVKDLLHDLLYSDFTGDEKIKETLEHKGAATNEVNGLLYQMVKRSGRSSTMAELLFKLHGDLQDGTNVQVNVINQMSDDQIQAELDKLGGGNGCINITPEPPKIE